MVVAKVWQLVRRPKGLPTLEDFKCVEEELPPCNEGGLYTLNLLSISILTMYCIELNSHNAHNLSYVLPFVG